MSSYYQFLFECNLDEGYFPWKYISSKMANLFIDKIKNNYKVISYHNAKSKYHDFIVSSIYFTVQTKIHFLNKDIDINIKIRSSDHPKPEEDTSTDVDVFINAYPNSRIEDESNQIKIKEAIQDLKIEKYNKLKFIKEQLLKVNDEFIKDYKNNKIEFISKKYKIPKWIAQSEWFNNFINQKSKTQQ